MTRYPGFLNTLFAHVSTPSSSTSTSGNADSINRTKRRRRSSGKGRGDCIFLIASCSSLQPTPLLYFRTGLRSCPTSKLTDRDIQVPAPLAKKYGKNIHCSRASKFNMISYFGLSARQQMGRSAMVYLVVSKRWRK